MTLIEEIMEANERHESDYKGGHKPEKELAIVTCMDTRLVGMLEGALGLKRGDVKVIKTAGNTITGVFDQTIRSLLVCVYELGVKEIAVIGHYSCGMIKTTAASLKDAMIKRGINIDAIKMIEKDLEQWADGFKTPEENVKQAVKAIRENPLIANDVKVHGLMIEPHSGKLDWIINGYED